MFFFTLFCFDTRLLHDFNRFIFGVQSHAFSLLLCFEEHIFDLYFYGPLLAKRNCKTDVISNDNTDYCY